MSKFPIILKSVTGVLALSWFGALAFYHYTGQLTWASKPEPIILQAPCREPQITSIQFGAEIVKFLVLNDRLHLLMPLPITGSSANIVDIRASMKKLRN